MNTASETSLFRKNISGFTTVSIYTSDIHNHLML